MTHSPSNSLYQHPASLLLAITLGALSISLYSELMLWVVILSLCAMTMRITLYAGLYKHIPHKRTINLLALLSIVALGAFSVSLGLLMSMVNLIVMASALKLMIFNHRRDTLQLVCTLLFVIGCGFIFQQSMIMSVFYACTLFLLMASLASVYAPSKRLRQQGQHVALLIIQALPITLLLFLALPQLPPMWKMPSAKNTQTGMTDTVTPGDVANLSQSADLAFRATFTGEMPSPEKRYWRVITLEDFNGATWTVSPTREQLEKQLSRQKIPFTPVTYGAYWQYDVITESTGQHWLAALDVALAASPAMLSTLKQSTTYQLVSRLPVNTQMVYSVKSYPNVPLPIAVKGIDKSINLKIPKSGDPKTRAWVKSLQQQYQSDQAFIQGVLTYFKEQDFRYTLQPPPMPTNGTDTFLFDAKAGFCAHYASATAYILRLAGIPARMVAGYHGGEELRPDVLSIYQYDAHAWVEAYIENTGWVRIDPTGAVAPMRIRFGLEAAMQEEGSFLADNQLGRLRQMPLLADIHKLFENMDYLWSRWVLGFNADKQHDLLKLLLGKLSPLKFVLYVLTLLALLTLLLALYFLPHWYRVKPPKDIHYWYHNAVKKAQDISTITRSSQGPSSYAKAIKGHCSEFDENAFLSLTAQYVNLTYQATSVSDQQATHFIRACKNFIKTAKPQSPTHSFPLAKNTPNA